MVKNKRRYTIRDKFTCYKYIEEYLEKHDIGPGDGITSQCLIKHSTDLGKLDKNIVNEWLTEQVNTNRFRRIKCHSASNYLAYIRIV